MSVTGGHIGPGTPFSRLHILLSFAAVGPWLLYIHLERQRGSIVVFSLSVYSTKWYIFKDSCKVKIITVLSHKAPRRLQRHESTQSETRSGSRYAQLELDRANGQLGGT